MSQYAPQGVKSLCITSSQTVYVRKPDLVSSKTLQRLGGRLICEIYLNTYFQRARLGGRLICELGLYASMYGKFHNILFFITHPTSPINQTARTVEPDLKATCVKRLPLKPPNAHYSLSLALLPLQERFLSGL